MKHHEVVVMMTLEIANTCKQLHKTGYLSSCDGCPLQGKVEQDYCYEDAMELLRDMEVRNDNLHS